MSYTPEQPQNSAPSPFEQASTLAHDLHARHHSHNTLVMEPFGHETGGVVLPVFTSLTYDELPTQGARMDHHDIDVSQRYSALTAQATYVGLWPQGNQGNGAAVLYKSQAVFTPEVFSNRLPFRETINELLQEYNTLATTQDADIKGKDAPTTPPYLKGTQETKLVERNVGYNRVQKTRFWSPTLSGLVETELPYGHIVQITDKTLLSAVPKTISLELPGGDEQKSIEPGFHTLPEDASLTHDSESGEIRFIDARGAVHAPPRQYSFNPLLVDPAKTIYEQAANQLKWSDITGRVLDNNIKKLYEKAGITRDAAYNAIQDRALKELEKARRGLKSEQLATAGVVTYLQNLQRVDATAGKNVTRSFTTLR